MTPPTITTIPSEILEYIAYLSTTDTFLGPPSSIIPLLLSCKHLNSRLALHLNPHLYSLIFASKFDLAAPRRRFTQQQGQNGTRNEKGLPASALADELRRRCLCLKGLRNRRAPNTAPLPSACSLTSTNTTPTAEPVTDLSVLWVAYLMMIENDGRNEAQLRRYGGIDEWLSVYWFHPVGKSRAIAALSYNEWPVHSPGSALAMWLFWFLLKPETCIADDANIRPILSVLKLYALAAHKYPLCWPSWTHFGFASTSTVTSSTEPSIQTAALTPAPITITHFNRPLTLLPPPIGAPAILSYITLANSLPPSVIGNTTAVDTLVPVSTGVEVSGEEGGEGGGKGPSWRWEGEWRRCKALGDGAGSSANQVMRVFQPGSLDCTWEGNFTYTEFTAHAALLSGAPPSILQKSLVAQHRQTWILREYHLVESRLPTVAAFSTSEERENRMRKEGAVDEHERDGAVEEKLLPISEGKPLRAHIPANCFVVERADGFLEVREPFPHPGEGQSMGTRMVLYKRHTLLTDDEIKEGRVKDVLLVGEGHSAWGQFSLIGRVRPLDGFMSVAKDYADGDRGNWLYRGYLVGNDADGNIVGRWRDTLTPAEQDGYEGGFVMTRRR